MSVRNLGLLLRCGVLLLTGAAAGMTAWLLARGPLLAATAPVVSDGPPNWRAVDQVPFDDALLALCAAVLLGCLLWLLVAAALAMAAQVAEGIAPASRSVRLLRRACERGCPLLVRRLVGAGLGVALTAGLATAPTLAAPPGGPDPLTGLPLPDRPTGSARAAATAASAAATVVVRPGQSLWSITADLLPASATDADITIAWHRLHRANAGRIGTDPDLILPGTRLVVPRLAPAPDREEAS
jgi:hypothetical protein